MRKVILLLGVMLCLFTVYGQGYKKRSPEERARYYTDEMVHDIKLDAKQEEKIYQINIKVSLLFDSLYTVQSDKQNSKQGAVYIYKKRDQLYREVLTTEQFLRFDDIQRDRREKKQKERLEKEKLEKQETQTMPVLPDTTMKMEK